MLPFLFLDASALSVFPCPRYSRATGKGTCVTLAIPLTLCCADTQARLAAAAAAAGQDARPPPVVRRRSASPAPCAASGAANRSAAVPKRLSSNSVASAASAPVQHHSALRGACGAAPNPPPASFTAASAAATAHASSPPIIGRPLAATGRRETEAMLDGFGWSALYEEKGCGVQPLIGDGPPVVLCLRMPSTQASLARMSIVAGACSVVCVPNKHSSNDGDTAPGEKAQPAAAGGATEGHAPPRPPLFDSVEEFEQAVERALAQALHGPVSSAAAAADFAAGTDINGHASEHPDAHANGGGRLSEQPPGNTAAAPAAAEEEPSAAAVAAAGHPFAPGLNGLSDGLSADTLMDPAVLVDGDTLLLLLAQGLRIPHPKFRVIAVGRFDERSRLLEAAPLLAQEGGFLSKPVKCYALAERLRHFRALHVSAALGGAAPPIVVASAAAGEGGGGKLGGGGGGDSAAAEEGGGAGEKAAGPAPLKILVAEDNLVRRPGKRGAKPRNIHRILSPRAAPHFDAGLFSFLSLGSATSALTAGEPEGHQGASEEHRVHGRCRRRRRAGGGGVVQPLRRDIHGARVNI